LFKKQLEIEIERAKEQAEKELEEIGVTKDDLENKKKKSAIILFEHPLHAKRLQKIVKEAMLETA
jgi:hypothetical protein